MSNTHESGDQADGALSRFDRQRMRELLNGGQTEASEATKGDGKAAKDDAAKTGKKGDISKRLEGR